MRIRYILVVLLMLNYSLMSGEVEAAHFPDEHHPYGHAVGFHAHDDAGLHDGDHDTQPHGLHIHLNCDLPSNPDFAFPRADSQQLTFGTFLHESPAYSPPVPPPNR